MTEEATPRVKEKPATHKSKTRRYFIAAFGIIFLVLFFNFIKYQYDRANGNTGRKKQEQPVAAAAPVQDRSAFDDLVKREQASEERKQATPAPVEQPAASGAQPTATQRATGAWDRFKKREQAEEQPQLSAMEKEEQKFAAEERARALRSARAHWEWADEQQRQQRNTSRPAGGPARASMVSSGTGSAATTSEQARRLLDAPMPESGSLEQRRAEVARRIDAAQRLREALRRENADGQGAGSPAVQQQQAQLDEVRKGFDQPPPDIAGYAKSNTYNADIDGKLLLPPGTEIPATFARKGVSDYQGSQLKGIVSRDVYDLDRQNVLIPKGSEVIMRVVKASNVNEAIQHRMGIVVAWCILPNGRKIDMSKAAGLDREGIGAIADQVEYHIMAQLLGVAAYAVVGSNASYQGSGTSQDATFAGEVGDQSRRQASNIAQKYLNIVPTVTIRPGQSFYVSTEEDLYIEPWKNVYASYVN